MSVDQVRAESRLLYMHASSLYGTVLLYCTVLCHDEEPCAGYKVNHNPII